MRLLAATAMIQALGESAARRGGHREVHRRAPGGQAQRALRGPGQAVFSIDLRHPTEATLRTLGDGVPAICAANAGPCSVKVEELVSAMPLEFPISMRDEIRAAAQRLGLRTMELPSAAGHDARYLHGICPSGMIFVPCKDGISHNEAESATSNDLYDGARVLAETLAALADR